MLLNIPQCIGQAPPSRKNFSVPNVKVAKVTKVEETWAKSGVRGNGMGHS